MARVTNEYCTRCGHHRTWYHYPATSPRFGTRYLRGSKGLCAYCNYELNIKPYVREPGKITRSDCQFERWLRLKRRYPYLTLAEAARMLNVHTRTISRYVERRREMTEREENALAGERVRRKPGDVVVAKNGYSYTYIREGNEVKRVLTHHLVAQKKYGRPPAENERVVFDDGDRTNLDPSNISYAVKNGDTRKALLRRRATLEDKINELQAELDLVNKRLRESS